MESFSYNLKNCMRKKQLTQAELAIKADIRQGTISKYLNGRTPKADELFRLAKALEVSMDDLFGEPSK